MFTATYSLARDSVTKATRTAVRSTRGMERSVRMVWMRDLGAGSL